MAASHLNARMEGAARLASPQAGMEAAPLPGGLPVEGFDWAEVARISHSIREAAERGRAVPLCDAQVERMAYAVYVASLRYDLEPGLLLSLICTESAFDAGAVSPVGARGLTQLMPRTGRYVASELGFSGDHIFHDPSMNIMGGAFYLREMLDRFGGHLPTALAAYNCGPTDIDMRRACGEFYPSGYRYVRKVLGESRRFFLDAPSLNGAI